MVLALAVLLGALGLRLVNCQRGMWGDEITTFWVSHLPADRIVEERLVHNHLPTYFLLMHAWTAAVGAGKFTLRLPSIIPGAVAVAAFFLICARRFPLRLSLLAAALLALNATQLFVSQSARMYGLTGLLEVLFFGCLLADREAPSRTRYLAYAAVVVAGCSLHLLFLELAAVAAILILWEARTLAPPGTAGADAGAIPPKRLARILIRYLAPFLFGGLLMAVWANHAAMISPGQGTGPEISWMNVESTPLPLGRPRETPPRRRVVDPLRTMIRIPFGDTVYSAVLQTGWPKYAARIGLGILAGGLAWAAFRRRRFAGVQPGAASADAARCAAQGVDSGLRPEQLRALRFALLWALVPPLTVLAGEMAWPWVPGLQLRWLAGGTAAWALLLAGGVCRLPGPAWRRRAALVTVLALSAYFASTWLRYPGDGLPQACAYWRAHAAPGDKVFLAHRGYLEQAMEIEQVPLPPESLRSGAVLDDTAPELAQRLREFAAGAAPVWVLHYQGPRKEILEQAFALLAPGWRADLVFECTATSVYRLTPVSR